MHFQPIAAQVLVSLDEHCLLSCVIVGALAQASSERVCRSPSIVKGVQIAGSFQLTDAEGGCQVVSGAASKRC